MENLTKTYPTLHDVFMSGFREKICLFRLEKTLEHNGFKFNKDQIFYIPTRSYPENQRNSSKNRSNPSSVFIYTYPEGDLYNLPGNVKGDFVQHVGEDHVLVDSIIQNNYFLNKTNENNETNTEYLMPANTDNTSYNTTVANSDEPDKTAEAITQKARETPHKHLIYSNTATHACNQPHERVYSHKMISEANLAQENSNRTKTDKPNLQSNNIANQQSNRLSNERKRTDNKSSKYENHSIIPPRENNSLDECITWDRLEVPNPLSPPERKERTLPHCNSEVTFLDKTTKHHDTNSTSKKETNIPQGLKVRTLRTASRHFNGTEYDDIMETPPPPTGMPSEPTGISSEGGNINKRFSIFTDKEYVRMSTIEKFEFLLSNCSMEKNNTEYEVGNDVIDDQKDYLDMLHPTLFFAQFYQKPQTTMLLRSNSSYQSCVSNVNKNQSYSTSNSGNMAGKNNSKTLKATTKCKSLEDLLRVDGSKQRMKDPGNQNNSANSSSTAISLYQRLMKEVMENFDTSNILNYNEASLTMELDFNRFESRLIYYSTRGWLPIELPPSRYWQDKFPDDFSVSELYLYIESLGNQRLADYLRNYKVDGYFMKLLIKDDLLLDVTLFDDSWITRQELEIIRSRYHPKRPRCYAVDAKTIHNLIEAV